MKNKKIAALLGILLAGSMAFSLSACGNSNDSASDAKSDTSTSDTTDKSSDSSADDSNGAGFEEIQVDEKHSDQDVDALTVNAVYFTSVAFHQVNTLFYAKSLPRPCSRTVSGIFQLDLSSCNRMRRNNKFVIIFGVYYYSFRIVDYSILLKRLCGSSKLF